MKNIYIQCWPESETRKCSAGAWRKADLQAVQTVYILVYFLYPYGGGDANTTAKTFSRSGGFHEKLYGPWLTSNRHPRTTSIVIRLFTNYPGPVLLSFSNISSKSIALYWLDIFFLKRLCNLPFSTRRTPPSSRNWKLR